MPQDSEQTTKRWFRRQPKAEDRALTPDSIPPSMLISTDAGEENVSSSAALRMADVFACVHALVNAAVLCPIRCWRDTDAGRVPMTGGRGVELLRQPQPGMAQATLVARLVQHYALWGECFVGKIRDASGQIAQLEALDPARVVKRIDAGQPLYDYYAPLGPVFNDLTGRDVIHVLGMVDPATGIRGASPIAQCRDALGLASSLTTSASALWANSAVPQGVLTIPAGVNADDQLETLKTAWSKRHQGSENRGKVAVLTGDVKWQSVSMPLSDAEFVATRELSTREICRIFGVPPSIVNAQGGGSLTYSTVAQEAQGFYTLALAPIFRLIEDALSLDTDLFPVLLSGCSFDADELLRADVQTRYASYVEALGAGFLTVEEVRAKEGLGPLPKQDLKTPDAAPEVAAANAQTPTVDPAAVKVAQQLAVSTLRKG
ncbi:MAG: phage portal protein [Solirubrobacterales bacterium]|nr:phage portal protein [Solirubrobacterales bacterium]